jgi:carboxyl-terminal processing protease
MKFRPRLIWLSVVLVALVASYVLGFLRGKPKEAKPEANEVHARLLRDVLDLVDKKYASELSEERKRKLVEDMLDNGLRRLDRHASFLSAQDYGRIRDQDQGQFTGIGIEIASGSGDKANPQIIRLMPGGPAAKAGVQTGDVLIRINGKPTTGLPMAEVRGLLRGDSGEVITLTVRHPGAPNPVDVAVVRTVIKVPSIVGERPQSESQVPEHFFLDNSRKIAYLRVTDFTTSTASELRKTIEPLQDQGLRGLILDLRDNPGGLLKAAVEVADLFLTEGVIGRVQGRSREEEVYRAKPEETLLLPPEEYPLVVLINRDSASASELVAAALQDHKRAVLVGERTFGKGSVQTTFTLPGNRGALKLTTAFYQRPNGKNIHRFPDSKETDAWGVLPDPGLEVALTTKEHEQYRAHRRSRDVLPGAGDGKGPAALVPASAIGLLGSPDGAGLLLTVSAFRATGGERNPYVDRILEKALTHLRSQIQ